MLDFASIRSVTLDIADTYEDGEFQDQTAEMILKLLTQNYQIYLFSSNPEHAVAMEDFDHPGLRFLREPMPPKPDLAAHFKDLTAETNLWISDDPDIGRWAVEHQLPLASRRQPDAAGARKFMRYHMIGEVAAALDATGRVLAEIARLLPSHGTEAAPKARLIGIGGPPLSGQAELALALKQHLESVGYELVELLDLSSLELEELVRLAEPSPKTGGASGAFATVADWLRRAKAGESFSVETLPEEVPQDFAAHLPLFFHGESVVIAFASTVFQGELGELFDVCVLLEVDELETTRRIYEIDEESVDTSFTDQYLSHEGRVYRDYLREYQVRERATLRVDANRPGTFALLPVER